MADENIAFCILLLVLAFFFFFPEIHAAKHSLVHYNIDRNNTVLKQNLSNVT